LIIYKCVYVYEILCIIYDYNAFYYYILRVNLDGMSLGFLLMLWKGFKK